MADDAPLPRAPLITRLSWGRVELTGGHVFKDVKLFPGGARAWSWDETGTRHSPGVQVADVEELLERGAEEVILSRGMLRRLQVPQETIAALEARGVTVHVLPTQAAVKRYTDLRRENARPLGALLHSTC